MNTSSFPYIEVLRGRDGRDGRDGVPGPRGPQGQRGDQGVAGPPGPRNGGVVYTRWGKSTCPSVSGTTLVYAGRAGGTWYQHKGGAANYLCMPNDPDYLSYQSGVQGYNYVYGAEYETHGGPLTAVRDHNVPCAVCYASTRVAVTMIPAKTQCPSTWTLEYSGYLMSGYFGGSHYRTMYECVDKTQTQCLAVLLTLTVLYFTMLKPTAMECCVHLMIHRKNSPVQFVPNRGHH